MGYGDPYQSLINNPYTRNRNQYRTDFGSDPMIPAPFVSNTGPSMPTSTENEVDRTRRLLQESIDKLGSTSDYLMSDKRRAENMSLGFRMASPSGPGGMTQLSQAGQYNPMIASQFNKVQERERMNAGFQSGERLTLGDQNTATGLLGTVVQGQQGLAGLVQNNYQFTEDLREKQRQFNEQLAQQQGGFGSFLGGLLGMGLGAFTGGIGASFGKKLGGG